MACQVVLWRLKQEKAKKKKRLMFYRRLPLMWPPLGCCNACSPLQHALEDAPANNWWESRSMPAAKHDICWLGHWTPVGDICRAAFHPLAGYLCGPRPLRARMNAFTLLPSWVPHSHRATALTHMLADRYTVHTHINMQAHTIKCSLIYS